MRPACSSLSTKPGPAPPRPTGDSCEVLTCPQARPMPLSPMPCGQDRFSSRASAPEACGDAGEGGKDSVTWSRRLPPSHSPGHVASRQPRCSLRDRTAASWPRGAGLAPMTASRTAITDTNGSSPRALAAPRLCVSDVHNPRLTGCILHMKSDAQPGYMETGRGQLSSASRHVPAAPPGSAFTGSHLFPRERHREPPGKGRQEAEGKEDQGMRF